MATDLQWIHPDADAVAALTLAPAECFIDPVEPERARLARLGRVAFRSPILLGGLAGRVGLSCDSCHRNGHDNPDFHITGVSGEPGTADVTGSVFSTQREDGQHNPVPIPTLVDSGSTAPFGSVLSAADLKTFVHVAIVEEFQGEPPPRPVVEGMVAYIEGLQSAGCPTPLESRVSFEGDADALLETLDVVSESFDSGDRRASEFALLSLRAALERLYRRFPAQVLDREELVERSRALSQLRVRFDDTRPSEWLALLAVERTRLESTLRLLRGQVDVSYYEPTVLRRALLTAP